MTARAHAKLSASGAYRWLACPPSAALEAEFPETSSPYAEEGTQAHSLAEAMLRNGSKNTDEKILKLIYSPEMIQTVGEYVDHVIEKFRSAQKTTEDAVMLLEERLDFSRWVPGGFGTGDVVIIADGVCEVIDLKYGQGVPVSAIENPQTRLYGLGAIANYAFLYDIKEIRMTIIQPRLDSITTETLTVDELIAWGESITPIALLADAGEGEFNPGEKQCKFCAARHTCRARAEQNLELAQYEFQTPPLLSDDEVADVLARIDALVSWANDVKDYALDQAVNHDKAWPGFKLVEGRSVRQYSDEDSVVSALQQLGVDEALMYERRLLTLSAMEKLVGKKLFGKLPEGLIVKSTPKPVLVPDSDKRPAINSTTAAQADFAQEG
jgi:hypothetical protein